MMGFQRLRRRVALWIAPELATLPPFPADGVPAPRSPAYAGALARVRRLDRLYSAHVGMLRVNGEAPAYAGPPRMHHGRPDSADAVRRRALQAIVASRDPRKAGMHFITEHSVIDYFASIWPDRLVAWPTDIPRPAKKKDAA